MNELSEPSRRVDAADFDAFVRSNFADVWRFVRRRVANGADADDVTAEVFATAWRRRHDLSPTTERGLWLFGVARHTLANSRRSTARRDRLHLRVVGERPPTTVEAADPADHGVWRALADLDRDDRDLLLMRAWDGLAVADIAAVLAISPNAASQRLAAARRRFAMALAEAGHTSGAIRTCRGRSRTDAAPGETAEPPDDEEHDDER